MSAPVGRPSNYNPEFHPQEIIKLMKEQGYTSVQVVRDWEIDISTLHEWLSVHPEFSKAYTRAKQYRRAWWVDQGQRGLFTYDDQKFDSRLFGMMMKYDGINLDERIVKLPELANCKTFSEQSTVICGALACGRITVKEAQGYVDVIATCAKIEEVTELKQKLKEIEEKLNVG